MLTLGVVSLLTLYTVALLSIRANLRNDVRILIRTISELRTEHGQELRRHNASLDTLFARVEAQTDALFEHEQAPHPKPPARKPAAKKAPAKKAAPKKATPAKKAPRQRSVS